MKRDNEGALQLIMSDVKTMNSVTNYKVKWGVTCKLLHSNDPFHIDHDDVSNNSEYQTAI